MELSYRPFNDLPARLARRGLAAFADLRARLNRRVVIGAGLALLIVVGAVALLLVLSRDEGMPDLREFEQGIERKAAFFDFLTPVVMAGNREIRRERDQLLSIEQEYSTRGRIALNDELWLKALARRYRVAWNPASPGAAIAELKLRVDVVPVPLVLVQAAKESAWGTSRFAREANNLFGQWCYEEGCGLVPARRNPEASHEVELFDSVEAAVEAYLMNINSGSAYGMLRQERAELRRQGEKLAGEPLADGLLFYSQRRQQYVDEVKSMLRQYHDFVDEQNP